MTSAEYEQFDVVRMPFPFSDAAMRKHRPGVVISSRAAFGAESGCAVIAMVTTGTRSSFPLDVPLRQWEKAGLLKACLMRMKLFTVDTKLIEKKLGRLQAEDRRKVAQALRRLIPALEKEAK